MRKLHWQHAGKRRARLHCHWLCTDATGDISPLAAGHCLQSYHARSRSGSLRFGAPGLLPERLVVDAIEPKGAAGRAGIAVGDELLKVELADKEARLDSARKKRGSLTGLQSQRYDA